MTSIKMGVLLAVAVSLAFGTLIFVILNVQSGNHFQTQTLAATTGHSAVPTGAPYVLISYVGYVYTQFSPCKPNPGNVYLILQISIQNKGYERVPLAKSGFGNPYPYYFYLAVGNQQFNGFPFSCIRSDANLPMTEVLNGLTVTGYLTFEIPANFGSYSLIYKSETESYNVQYVNLGVTSVTETQTQTQALQTTTSQPREQLILENYLWTGGVLQFTLRNVGSVTVTIAAVYLGGVEQTVATRTLSTGSTASYSIALVGQYTLGTAYTLKVVTQTGAVFAFTVVAGSSG